MPERISKREVARYLRNRPVENPVSVGGEHSKKNRYTVDRQGRAKVNWALKNMSVEFARKTLAEARE